MRGQRMRQFNLRDRIDSGRTRAWSYLDRRLGPLEQELGVLPPTRAPMHPGWRGLQALDSVQVVSPGRSGTRWLADVLLATTNCQVTHATRRTLGEVGFLYDRDELGRDAALGAYLQSRLPLMSSSLLTGRMMVDLDCKNSPLARPLADQFWAMRFLVVIRNPIGFCVSGLERGYFSQKVPFTWGHLCPRGYDSPYLASRELSLSAQAVLVMWFWNRIALNAQALLKDHPSRVTILPVSQIFQDPELLIDRLTQTGIDVGREKLAQFSNYSRPRNKNPVSQDRRILEDHARQALPQALDGLDAGFVDNLGL